MPSRLPQETRQQVIQLWMQNFSPENIAERIGIAPGSVRNIIEELKRGDHPEYDSFLAYLGDLRLLSGLLRTKRRSLPQAIIGITVFEGLVQMDIDPSELKKYLQPFKK